VANFLLNNSVFIIGATVLISSIMQMYYSYFRSRKTSSQEDFNLIKIYSIMEARKSGKKYHPDLYGAWSRESIKD